MQKSGRAVYSKKITTSQVNQELLNRDEIESLYGYRGRVVIHFEIYNVGETEITLIFNEDPNSIVKLESKYGQFSTDGKIELYSVQVAEVGSTVKFLCVLL